MDPSELNHRLAEDRRGARAERELAPQASAPQRVYHPSRDSITEIVKRLRELIYPGYFGKQGPDD
jgi:hypothetical protein